uniref:phospholipase D n=1 Tax=Pectobacterium carotovorum TaxID=554 RepID=A0A0N9NS29_PECCA|nr:phospholipase D family protein [Pectobacterium carotovorum]ALG88605.1 Phospholipase D precursor [Pectobacterium carotovorum]
MTDLWNLKGVFMRLFTLIGVLLASSSMASAEVMVGFSPDGSAEKLVLQSFGQARTSIDIAVYTFTSRPVAIALLSAWRQGISVRVLADEKLANERYSAVSMLANQGVPVRVNGHYAAQHNKFAVINRAIVQTGSLNYSKAALTGINAENVLVISGETAVTQAYQQEFERLWAEGTPLKTNY